MKRMRSALVAMVVLAATSACVGTDRQPECHGPWTPINVVQASRHG